jgi:DNA polymerase-3 subunit delta'
VAPEADVFAALAGQPQAAELLRHAVASDHVAHAYAFVGPAGSGRKAAAQAFAAALVSHGGASASRAADRIARGVHPDVHRSSRHHPSPIPRARSPSAWTASASSSAWPRSGPPSPR